MKKQLAILGAVLVTLLWSTSYFINKIAFGLQIGPLMLAGIRYFLAGFFTLISFKFTNKNKQTNSVTKLSFIQLLLLGVTGFAMAQGLQYAGQKFLIPTQTSLVLNITNTSAVLLLEVLWLKENKLSTAIIGMTILVMGSLCYFYPFSFAPEDILGIGLVAFSSLGYALNLALNRKLLKDKSASPAQLVAWPMILGSLFLISTAIILKEPFVWSSQLGLVLIWLALVNGTIAFTLWTWAQKSLTILETSLINNLMLIEIALMDVFYAHRVLSGLQWFGILLVALAVVSVQVVKILEKKKQLV